VLKTVLAVVYVLSYGTVVVFAGHSVGPAALILLFGTVSEYLSSMILGWLGIVALGIGLMLVGRRSESAIVAGGVGHQLCGFSG
jgi:hypothetical protein